MRTVLASSLGAAFTLLLAPGQVVAAVSPALATGGDHSCAIQDGAAFCWGENTEGELGNGEDDHSSVGSVDRNEPVAVMVFTSGATAVSGGEEHTCGIQNGAAFCWGWNGNGQLGNGEDDTTVPTGAFSNVPLAVVGLGSLVTSISTGGAHSCGVMDGAAHCWGYNNKGQLGNASNVDSNLKVAVTGLASNVTMISAGDKHSCAIQNGAALCWGKNFHGQLGDGTNLDSSTPVAVTGLTSDVTAISAGNGHTCAIQDGNAFCWGSNSTGELGDGNSPTNSNLPVDVTGLDTDMDVSAISAGSAHTCAVKNGAALCWGADGNGQLGDGNSLTNSDLPVGVKGLGSGVTAISGGGDHTCATAGGAAFCWGSNSNGQLGDGTNAIRPVPVRVLDFEPGNDPSVAVCGTVAHHAWASSSGNIRYRSCAVGVSCTAARNLVAAASQERRPSVACSGSTVLVAWEDTRDGSADVAYRRSPDGGASFDALKFLTHGPLDETRPVLVMSGGVALAVWEDSRRGNRDLGSRRSVDGGQTWGAFSFLVRSALDESEPSLSMDGDVAALAWVDRRHGNQDIAFRRSTNIGASWLPITFLARGPAIESEPSVALDGATMLVGWTDRRWGNDDPAFRRSVDAGANFGPRKFLLRASTDDSQLILRVDGLNGLLSWVDNRSGNRNVSYRHSADGGATWGSALRLVAASTDESQPACDLSGDLASCVWTDTRSGDPSPHARDSIDGGASWLARFELD